MRYFKTCLQGIPEHEEIDISVHCDAEIFEWLLQYIKYKEKHGKSPPIIVEDDNNDSKVEFIGPLPKLGIYPQLTVKI
jgi:hypothetical protein